MKTKKPVTPWKRNRFSCKWYHQESNRGHTDFQSVALPTELWHQRLFASAKVGRFFVTTKFISNYFIASCQIYSFSRFTM